MLTCTNGGNFRLMFKKMNLLTKTAFGAASKSPWTGSLSHQNPPIRVKLERQPLSDVISIFSNSKKATGTFAGTSDAFDVGSGNMIRTKGMTRIRTG